MNPLIFIIILAVKTQSKEKSPTVAPVGTWSKWGPWQATCSKTCGIGVRRRTRTCGYTGDKERRCKGPVGQLRNCDTKIMCPIHGGWTPWTSWRCTASCGGGEGSQRRTCTNPKPMYNGKGCEGPAEENGKCNTHKCPDEIYTLSPETVQEIETAADENHNFEKLEGETVKIPCSELVVTKVYKEYPMTTLSWRKDGKVVKLDHERMEVAPTELAIEKLNKDDTGIYICTVQYVSQVVKRVTLAALSVESSKPDIKVHEEHSMKLLCKGSQLPEIFGNTTQQWLFDGKVVRDFGTDSPTKHSVYKIKEVKKNMTGKWSCKIKHTPSGKEWTTNIVVVEVLPPKSKILRFLTNTKVLVIAAVSLFVFLMLAGALFAYVIAKARDEFMEDFNKWRQIAEWEEKRYGGVPEWARLKDTKASEEDETQDDNEDDAEDIGEKTGIEQDEEDAGEETLVTFSD